MGREGNKNGNNIKVYGHCQQCYNVKFIFKVYVYLSRKKYKEISNRYNCELF